MNDRLARLCPGLAAGNAHVAVAEGGKSITYEELWQGAENLATALANMGVMQGDRIGLWFENTTAFVHGYLGILRAGCIPVLIGSGFPVETVGYIVKDSGAVGVLTDTNLYRKLASVAAPIRFAFVEGVGASAVGSDIAVYSFEEAVRSKSIRNNGPRCKVQISTESSPAPREVATIIYTSGTTGKRKGVMLSERNISLAADVIVYHLGLTEADTCLVTISFTHCAGLLHMLAHLRVGGRIVVGEHPALMGSMLKAIRDHGITILPGVPSFFTLLLKYGKEKVKPFLGSLRAIETSSAMVNRSLIRELAGICPAATLFNTYGLTEAPRSTYARIQVESENVLTVGRPTRDVTVQIVDEHRMQCGYGEEGEIVLNGPNLALGYWNKPFETAAAFGPDGFKTGDIGFMEEDGFLYLRGRKDDMIKIGANAVYPQEVEDVVSAYPGIVDVVAYGVEDEIQGMRIHVQVVRKNEEIDVNALLAYCRDRLAKHTVPSKVVFCESIGIEESGKPRRSRAPL
jgi:acyl-CoA synthetase (AMP-forming)/AMP-acid ligase II